MAITDSYISVGINLSLNMIFLVVTYIPTPRSIFHIPPLLLRMTSSCTHLLAWIFLAWGGSHLLVLRALVLQELSTLVLDGISSSKSYDSPQAETSKWIVVWGSNNGGNMVHIWWFWCDKMMVPPPSSIIKKGEKAMVVFGVLLREVGPT